LGYLAPPPMPAPVIVMKDVGGFVKDYKAQTEQYRSENREVRLHECRSACTLALSLPNVCVYPSSALKFHQAYNINTKQVDEGISQDLFSSYPSAVKARLGFLTRQYKVLSGAELIRLGVRQCGDNRTIMVARADVPKEKTFAERVESAVSAALGRPASEQGRIVIAARPKEAKPNVPVTIGKVQTVSLKPQDFGMSPAPKLPDTPDVKLPPTPQFADVPLPPRRPLKVDTALFVPNAMPTFSQLMPGAQPILTASFVPYAKVAR
jgi:hypothetical protein